MTLGVHRIYCSGEYNVNNNHIEQRKMYVNIVHKRAHYDSLIYNSVARRVRTVYQRLG